MTDRFLQVPPVTAPAQAAPLPVAVAAYDEAPDEAPGEVPPCCDRPVMPLDEDGQPACAMPGVL